MDMLPPVSAIQLCRLLLLLASLLAPAAAAGTPLKDHFQTLGIERSAKPEEVEAAYQHLRNQLATKIDELHVRDKFVEVQHAYLVLSHVVRRRDYEIYGLDELQDVAREAKLSSRNATNPEDVLRPWDLPPVEPIQSATISLTEEVFLNSVLNSTQAWIIQLYSAASQRSREFAESWEKLSKRFEGVATLARVELGQIQLAVPLTDKNWVTRYPHFPEGLPEILVVKSSCQNLDCLVRYRGPRTWLDIEDWISTRVLKLPRILYHSPKALVNEVLPKSSPNKVIVVTLSNTGERAAPFVRQAAKVYREYATFECALWQQEHETFWEANLGVEAAPALVLLKDPGLKPIIYNGEVNGSTFAQLMENHKTHVLPQLRSISAADLGCDPTGYSRAGGETNIWYCVVLTGKPGFQLNYMRQILREVQDLLTKELGHSSNHHPLADISVAASAFGEKRLSLVWLDGVAQKHFCYFYLHGESMMEACGPRRYVEKDDIPKIFMVRYEREKQSGVPQQTRSLNMWQALAEEDQKLASQIVTKYNGSETGREIASWISKMVLDGDTAEGLPKFKGKPPPLTPEELPPMWSQGREYVSDVTSTLYQKGKHHLSGLSYILQQPRTAMMLVALLLVYSTAVFIKMKQDRQTEVLENVQQSRIRALTTH